MKLIVFNISIYVILCLLRATKMNENDDFLSVSNS